MSVIKITNKLELLPPSLQQLHAADYWSKLDSGTERVQCLLSPRQCKIPKGGLGFCGVRYNNNGVLETLNYGKSVAMTVESIETEGVFHAYPSESILSLGNIGCMMHCDFCQNWSTSQARLVSNDVIHEYTPEGVVKYALEHNIKILSWTYNDPVVWQEFVIETAALAKQAGLLNLYKSALYINPKPLDELIDVIDIFSISLKSLNDDFYRKFTKARLQPVLDAIKQIYRSDKHLELSNLIITDRNDNIKETKKVGRWILDSLSDDIPLHLVRFQPSYKYIDVAETSQLFLEEARSYLLDMGLKHVYVGNVGETVSTNTFCKCGATLLERSYLNTKIHLDENNACLACGKVSSIILAEKQQTQEHQVPDDFILSTTEWPEKYPAIRLEQGAEASFYYQFLDKHGEALAGLHHSNVNRLVVSKLNDQNTSLTIYYHPDNPISCVSIDARAHYPV